MVQQRDHKNFSVAHALIIIFSHWQSPNEASIHSAKMIIPDVRSGELLAPEAPARIRKRTVIQA